MTTPKRCHADRCTSTARYGPWGEPVACWIHAGDWPEILPPPRPEPLLPPGKAPRLVGEG